MTIPETVASSAEFEARWELSPSQPAERTQPKPRRRSPANEPDRPALKPLLEALVFASPAPITSERLAEIVRGAAAEEINSAVAELNDQYLRQGRPYCLKLGAEGLRFILRPNYQHVLEQVYGGLKEARLSAAAIEALAIVAYRQPAPKALVDSLRGQESGHLLRQLVRKGLLEVHPADDAESGDRFRTTTRFLELFALTTLDDLPRAEELPRL